MRVAALELPHRFGAVAAQLDAVDHALSAGIQADLVLLPECSLTGYLSPRGNFDLRRFAEASDGPTATRLAGLARKHRIALAGPLVERSGDAFYNTTIVFDAEGQKRATYRKRHPWYPERWATAGEDPLPGFEVAGAHCTIACCFDVHFLAAESADALRDADVLLFPSAWVDDEPIDARGPLLERLAADFEIAIVNANWGAGVPAVRGQGSSRIVDAEGREVVRAAPGGVAIADIAT